MKAPLDQFGQFVIQNLFDKGINQFQRLAHGEIKAPELLTLQQELKRFNKQEIAIIQKLIIEIMESSMHDFLFAIQERSEAENDIQITVEQHNIAEQSDGLHGEMFGENGWMKKYSNFKEFIP